MRDYYVPPNDKHFEYLNCHTWQKTFAWLPKKTVSGKRVWLKTLYKQRYYTAHGPGIGYNFHMELEVEYGELFDILKDEIR